MPGTHLADQLPLFVYGTLRPGERHFRRFLHGRTQTIRTATVRGRLYWHLAGDYPYLVRGEGRVTGELIQVNPTDWRQVIMAIDRLEDYTAEDEATSCYVRRQVEVRPLEGVPLHGWTYYWNRPVEGLLIVSGDWRQR